MTGLKVPDYGRSPGNSLWQVIWDQTIIWQMILDQTVAGHLGPSATWLQFNTPHT